MRLVAALAARNRQGGELHVGDAVEAVAVAVEADGAAEGARGRAEAWSSGGCWAWNRR